MAERGRKRGRRGGGGIMGAPKNGEVSDEVRHASCGVVLKIHSFGHEVGLLSFFRSCH